MKKILIFCVLAFFYTTLSVEEVYSTNKPYSGLISYLVKNWGRSEVEAEEIVVTALSEEMNNPGFPTALDILAVAQVESGFRSTIISPSGVGLMQVNHRPHKLEKGPLLHPQTNIKVGAEILRKYSALSVVKDKGTQSSIFVAYNSGPAGMTRKCKKARICESDYSRKVAMARSDLEKQQF